MKASKEIKGVQECHHINSLRLITVQECIIPSVSNVQEHFSTMGEDKTQFQSQARKRHLCQIYRMKCGFSFAEQQAGGRRGPLARMDD